MEKSGEQKLHESTQRLCRSTRTIQRGTIMRQHVQGEEVFRDEAQSRDYVWRLYNRKSLVLLMKTTSKNISNACKDGKRAVVKAPNWGGANAYHKRRPPMMKGEDTKESWCRWSCQVERRRSSKHRNQGGGLWGVYHNFLFLRNQWQWSPIVHMVVETFGATLKHLNWRRMRPLMKG